MALKVFKPMMRPMIDQPLDIDLFDSIYEAINSLNVSDIDFIVDNYAEPWGSGQGNVVTAASSSGLQLKIVAGIVAAVDTKDAKHVGRRGWVVNFPASASFTQPPVVVATAAYNSPGAEPVASTIRFINQAGFKILAQVIDNKQINISHWNYLAVGI